MGAGLGKAVGSGPARAPAARHAEPGRRSSRARKRRDEETAAIGRRSRRGNACALQSAARAAPATRLSQRDRKASRGA